MPLPIVAAALTALPNIIGKIGELFKKPDPKAAFDSAITDAQRAAKTAEEKQRVESLRLQGLKLMREWYAGQNPDNPPQSVAKWGQAGVEAYRKNIEQARLELGGTPTAFSGGTAPGVVSNFGYTGDEQDKNNGDLISRFKMSPKYWDFQNWAVVAVILFLFTPLKKIFR